MFLEYLRDFLTLEFYEVNFEREFDFRKKQPFLFVIVDARNQFDQLDDIHRYLLHCKFYRP